MSKIQVSITHIKFPMFCSLLARVEFLTISGSCGGQRSKGGVNAAVRSIVNVYSLYSNDNKHLSVNHVIDYSQSVHAADVTGGVMHDLWLCTAQTSIFWKHGTPN